MWKPGTEKPMEAGSLKQSPNNGTPSNGSAKKALSGSTMGMRFMQKRNQHQSPTPKKEDKDNVDMKVEDDPAVLEEPTNSDMYGMQSDLIGRRSFGGFKPKVDNNWQDCRKFISGEDNEGTKKKLHVSDDELLQRYQELVKGRSDHEKTSRTKKQGNCR